MSLFSRREPTAGTGEPEAAGPRTAAAAGEGPAARSSEAGTRATEPGTRSGEGPRARERRGYRWRTRDASAAAVGTVGSGVLLVARIVRTVAVLIALLIALAIVLRDVDANQANTIVKGVHEGANFFAGAFTGLIKFNGHPKRAITVDWGIAIVVYLLVGALIASMIARVGRGGLRYERSHRVAPTP